MSAPQPPDPTEVERIQERLHKLAAALRRQGHLHADEQRELAQVVDDLGRALKPGSLPDPDLAHLSESLGHLLQGLQDPHKRGLLTSANQRLEELAVRTQDEAPLVMGLVRRLIEALANLGI